MITRSIAVARSLTSSRCHRWAGKGRRRSAEGAYTFIRYTSQGRAALASQWGIPRASPLAAPKVPEIPRTGPFLSDRPSWKHILLGGRGRNAEEQTVGVLREQPAGTPMGKLCWRHVISMQIF